MLFFILDWSMTDAMNQWMKEWMAEWLIDGLRTGFLFPFCDWMFDFLANGLFVPKGDCGNEVLFNKIWMYNRVSVEGTNWFVDNSD